jgi:hypothetical protein
LGYSDWRLIFILALSLRRLREIIGTSKASYPRFCDNDWKLNEAESHWANLEPECGYHLIDFKKRFFSPSWDRQKI